MPSPKILLIDENMHQHKLFDCYASKTKAIEFKAAMDIDEGMVCMMQKQPDVILLDNNLDGDETYKQSVPQLRAFGYNGPIVVVSTDPANISQDELADYSVSDCFDKLDFDLKNFENKMSVLMAA